MAVLTGADRQREAMQAFVEEAEAHDHPDVNAVRELVRHRIERDKMQAAQLSVLDSNAVNTEAHPDWQFAVNGIQRAVNTPEAAVFDQVSRIVHLTTTRRLMLCAFGGVPVLVAGVGFGAWAFGKPELAANVCTGAGMGLVSVFLMSRMLTPPRTNFYTEAFGKNGVAMAGYRHNKKTKLYEVEAVTPPSALGVSLDAPLPMFKDGIAPSLPYHGEWSHRAFVERELAHIYTGRADTLLRNMGTRIRPGLAEELQGSRQGTVKKAVELMAWHKKIREIAGLDQPSSSS